MFSLASKLLINCRIIYNEACYSRCIHTLGSLNSASISKTQQSLTVSYLVNSCGLSLQRAILAAKRVDIAKTDRPDKVLRLLRAHGFAKSHITTLISKLPPLILADPDKTLQPKIEFFESIGVAERDMPKILCVHAQILLSSLKNKILPIVDFLGGILQSDHKVVLVLKRYPCILTCRTKVMVSNIDTLRAHGVPESGMRTLLLLEPRSLLFRVDLFRNLVQEVEEMGFESTSNSFVYALRSMSVMSRSLWEKKKQLLKSFGWSESDFLLAFRAQPLFMLTSEKKMKLLMEFFLTKLDMQPLEVVRCPNLFMLSLKERIMPRCSVFELLMAKGLINKNLEIIWVLNMSKKQFEKNFFIRFMQDCPELIKAYQV